MSDTELTVAEPQSHVTVLAPKAPPTPRAKGIDISSWQHPGGAKIDWHAVKAAGYDFVMVKASQGTTYVNPWLADDIPEAHAAGLIVGAYHFYEQGEPVAEQGAHFVAACSGHVLELGAWIDWEPPAMLDYQVQNDYDGLRTAIMEARRPVGLYCDLYWIAIFRRLNLMINRLWLGEWTEITDTQGVSIIQRPTAVVPGIEGEVDIDELLTIRGVSLPRVASPALPVSAVEVPAEVPAETALHAEPETEPPSEAGADHPAS